MIQKVERLISIGKFRNYQAAGQVNFHKLTLIFGDNGGGKTTLTSILRSLTTNSPEIIRNRISTNHTVPQSAQIIEFGTPYIYHTLGSGGWNSPFPNIEIFDIHFVNDNIYSGFEFTDLQRRKLHGFVIGAQGVAIQQQIESNKSRKSSLRQAIQNNEQLLLQQVGNGLTAELISSFLTIPIADLANIHTSILEAEQTLETSRANEVLQTFRPLGNLSRVNTGCDFGELITDMEMSIQEIGDQALRNLFLDHCNDLSGNLINAPESWLKEGFNYVKNKEASIEESNNRGIACPFCKQELDNSLNILEAYSSQFNTEFNSLIQRMSQHLLTVTNYNLEAVIQTLNNLVGMNDSRISSWSLYLNPNIPTPNFGNILNDGTIRSEFENLKSAIRLKSQNPSVSADTAIVTTFQTSIRLINSRIDTYNQVVNSYNIHITSLLNGIQNTNVAQNEVNRLKRIRIRFNSPIRALCRRIIDEKANLRILDTEYGGLIEQQELAATAFFAQYKERINHYLSTVFKTAFQISSVIHVPPQGQAIQGKIEYKITIDGRDISFEQGQPFCVKESLSEGDKSTIALSLFLSKLDIDQNLQDKILVFDDPLSSLDANRRSYTVGIIRNLVSRLKQVVVLSHSEHFLYDIGKDFRAADKKTLRISENFVTNESYIETCDLDELIKNDYFKHIDSLELFRSSPNLAIKDSVLGWMRNVLEAHLRFKFYREIRGMPGQKTLGSLIIFLANSPVVFKDNANRAAIIATLHVINGVSWMPHHGIPSPDHSSIIINPTTITARELDNLIGDTLNLIENQL